VALGQYPKLHAGLDGAYNDTYGITNLSRLGVGHASLRSRYWRYPAAVSIGRAVWIPVLETSAFGR